MRRLASTLILAALLSGAAFNTWAQITLPQVKIVASTYKYLNAADNKEMNQPVAVSKRFPNWRIAKDTYEVHYYEHKEKADKVFKLLLENGNKRLRVKLDETGVFL